MKLDDSRRSDNVEDDRGGGGGGGIRGLHLGLGGTVVVLVIGYFMGVSPSTLLSLVSGGDGSQATAPTPAASANDPQVDFVRAILGETEDVWGAYFSAMGKTYVRPKLVLFSGQVASACGFASAASGPFYCSDDRKVYIDLSFYRQLATEFGAPGDFARAGRQEAGEQVINIAADLADAATDDHRQEIAKDRAQGIADAGELEAHRAEHGERLRQLHEDLQRGTGDRGEREIDGEAILGGARAVED